MRAGRQVKPPDRICRRISLRAAADILGNKRAGTWPADGDAGNVAKRRRVRPRLRQAIPNREGLSGCSDCGRAEKKRNEEARETDDSQRANHAIHARYAGWVRVK